MKLIMESFRKSVLNEKIELPEPDRELGKKLKKDLEGRDDDEDGYDDGTGELVGTELTPEEEKDLINKKVTTGFCEEGELSADALSAIKQLPKHIEKALAQQKPKELTVSDYLEMYIKIEEPVEFYRKFDSEMHDLLDKYMPGVPQRVHETIVNIVSPFIRGNIGRGTGWLTDKGAQWIVAGATKYIVRFMTEKFGEPMSAEYVTKRIMDSEWTKAFTTTVSQMLADVAEKKLADTLAKYDKKKLDVKNLGSDDISVSPAWVNLIDLLDPKIKNKVETSLLDRVSFQLERANNEIKKALKTVKAEDPDKAKDFLQTPLDKFLKTRGVDFDEDGKIGDDENYTIRDGDEVASDLLSKAIGAKSVKITESKRRRIVYRGKK